MGKVFNRTRKFDIRYWLIEARRRYVDITFGYSIVGPLIAYSNFSLIAYNFTDLKNILPFELFIPLFLVGLGIILSFAGLVFRKYHLPTSFKMQYERNIEQVRTDYFQLLGIHAIFEHLGHAFNKKYESTIKLVRQRIEYLESVLEHQKYDVGKKI